MKTRVVIADDQASVRQGFRHILAAQPDMEVVAEAADGLEALEAVRTLRPDVLLVDIRMPELDGLEVTRRLAGITPEVKVVVVTTFDLDEYVHTALRNGACGFLLKHSGPALLAEAIRSAVVGDSLISPQITTRLLHRFTGPRRVDRSPVEPLTSREEEIAVLVAEGLTNSDIGAELFISLSTVKTHLANLQRKLKARNRVGIATWAWESGLTERG
ncbi:MULTISPECIES: response regulator transcription factor [Streptomycetaceae]|uniref:response regulator n=1 Tax=Streptomycetaceae TaxID=2062 RepID=UPI0006713C6C|nr:MULTISPECIES: response regulator transcription factor [Streptomycetaceae]OKI10463.1 LuxR family transcriptional regulator [Streptomyces sp. CB02056]